MALSTSGTSAVTPLPAVAECGGDAYRSDALHDLTDADAQLLAALGVRHICDLRRDPERDTAPDRLPPGSGVEIEHLPIGGLAAETKTMADRMMRGEIAEVRTETMAGVYATILRVHPDTFGTVVARAADPARLAMVVHCTAGKDRTGVASALILAALGADDEAILDDYELSHHYHSAPRMAEVRPRLEAVGVEFARVEAFFGVSRAVMAHTLADLRATYGSVEEYLTGPAGLDASVLTSLRDQLLT